MKKQIFHSIVIFILGIHSTTQATPSHILSLFFEWYPSLNKDELLITEYPEGIPVTYYGNKTITNQDGQASFPLYQSIPKFSKGKKLTLFIIICPSIDPLLVLHATVERLMLPKESTYKIYAIEKTYDKETQSYLWTVKNAR